jgi:hypothetical protein
MFRNTPQNKDNRRLVSKKVLNKGDREKRNILKRSSTARRVMYHLEFTNT